MQQGSANMAYHTSQKGFSMVEAGLIVLVFALISFVGFRVWSANQPVQSAQPVAQTQSAASVPQVKKAADLDVASKVMDAQQLDNSSLNALDAQLNY